jgi:16S rRNA (guanine(966)-N(2))-methyltransferase RsmD
MRIIGGKFKGHPLPVLKNFQGRPTTDFAKEGLMNTLHHLVQWEESQVLDLFSGTGALAMETLSRGALMCTMVENQAGHVQQIKKNLLQFQFKNAQVVKADVLVWVKSSSAQFDLVLADPPYDLPEISGLPEMFFPLLKDDGILVLEHGKDHQFEEHPNCFKEKRFGHVHFSFFSKLAP